MKRRKHFMLKGAWVSRLPEEHCSEVKTESWRSLHLHGCKMKQCFKSLIHENICYKLHIMCLSLKGCADKLKTFLKDHMIYLLAAGMGIVLAGCCWCNFRSNWSCFVLCININVKHKQVLWRQVNHWFFSLQKSWACSALSVSAAPSRGSTILKPESFNPLWLFWVFEIFGHWSFRSQILFYVLSLCRSLCLDV